jgi:hypothetical protein
MVVTETVTPSGGGLANFRVNSQATGVGEISGMEYVGQEAVEDHESFTPGITTNLTEQDHFELIAQGNAPNLKISASLHNTINPDGTVTSYFYNFSATCP